MLGAAFLQMVLKQRWMTRDADSRALAVTTLGRREMAKHIGLLV
jgi:hypothetical protein